VEKIVRPSPNVVTKGKLPQTPRVRLVLQGAIEEARNLNQNCVATEHLLLGLLREQQSTAGQILMNLGIDYEEVRAEIVAQMMPVPPSLVEKMARRAGAWVRRHPGIRIFTGALVATLAGALVIHGLTEFGTLTSGGLAGAVGFLVALVISSGGGYRGLSS
jgi:hypothetical protein